MRLAGQIGLVGLVIGTSVAVAATERVSVALVLTSTLAWTFVPVIQLLTGFVLLRRAPPGQRILAFERYFDTHRPWSLAILSLSALLLVLPASRSLTVLFFPLAVVPAVLTMRALGRVCRETLAMPPMAARRAVAVHQVATYLIVLAYAAWASAYVPRVWGLLS